MSSCATFIMRSLKTLAPKHSSQHSWRSLPSEVRSPRTSTLSGMAVSEHSSSVGSVRPCAADRICRFVSVYDAGVMAQVCRGWNEALSKSQRPWSVQNTAHRYPSAAVFAGAVSMKCKLRLCSVVAFHFSSVILLTHSFQPS